MLVTYALGLCSEKNFTRTYPRLLSRLIGTYASVRLLECVSDAFMDEMLSCPSSSHINII